MAISLERSSKENGGWQCPQCPHLVPYIPNKMLMLSCHHTVAHHPNKDAEIDTALLKQPKSKKL